MQQLVPWRSRWWHSDVTQMMRWSHSDDAPMSSSQWRCAHDVLCWDVAPWIKGSAGVSMDTGGVTGKCCPSIALDCSRGPTAKKVWPNAWGQCWWSRRGVVTRWRSEWCLANPPSLAPMLLQNEARQHMGEWCKGGSPRRGRCSSISAPAAHWLVLLGYSITPNDQAKTFTGIQKYKYNLCWIYQRYRESFMWKLGLFPNNWDPDSKIHPYNKHLSVQW